jgi:pimeloyl-ACP methyl ester carboxylesterase
VDSFARARAYATLATRSTAPTTLVWGERDLIVPLALGESMAAIVPAASLRVILGAGHNVQHERPEELMALIG